MKYCTCCLGEHKRLLMLNFRTIVYTFWTDTPKLHIQYMHTQMCNTLKVCCKLPPTHILYTVTNHGAVEATSWSLPTPNKTVCGSENALNRSHMKNLTCREASMEQVAIFFSSKGPLLSNSFRPKPVALCVRQTDQNFAVARKVHRRFNHLQSQ